MRYKSYILIAIAALLVSSQTPLAVWGNWEVVINVSSSLTNTLVYTEPFQFKRDFQYKIHWTVSCDGSWELSYSWWLAEYEAPYKEKIKGYSHDAEGYDDWTMEYDIGLKSVAIYHIEWRIDVFPIQEDATVYCKVEESVSDLNATTDDTSATSFGWLSLLTLPVYVFIRKKRSI